MASDNAAIGEVLVAGGGKFEELWQVQSRDRPFCGSALSQHHLYDLKELY